MEKAGVVSSHSTEDENGTSNSTRTSPATSSPPPKELAFAAADGAVEGGRGRAAHSRTVVLSKLMYDSLVEDLKVQTARTDRLHTRILTEETERHRLEKELSATMRELKVAFDFLDIATDMIPTSQSEPKEPAILGIMVEILELLCMVAICGVVCMGLWVVVLWKQSSQRA
ncbi:hypothetical protein LTR09_011412 [Extremus antarcticus]|uniref:Uncharacterized protein n=1 Tax=Extremus antarcticus TaxID=702011 RepID=A0AAJ0DCC6_9PEZI|nr:hypothetical protein LTR09_011412 [Extremus antarcticus]